MNEENTTLEIITNAAEVNAKEIPQSTINIVADILYDIRACMEAKRSATQSQAV